MERANEARQLALDARERARASRDAAARHQTDIAARKRALDAQVTTSKRAYERLSAKERAAHEATFGEHVAPPTSVVARGAALVRHVMASRFDQHVSHVAARVGIGQQQRPHCRHAFPTLVLATEPQQEFVVVGLRVPESEVVSAPGGDCPVADSVRCR